MDLGAILNAALVGPSIEWLAMPANKAGVGGRAHFEMPKAKEYPGSDYDLMAFFDCLHDMGDPAGASRHVPKSLKKDGTWMIVEPFAKRSRGGQSKPGPAGLTCCVHHDLHAGFTIARSGSGA